MDENFLDFWVLFKKLYDVSGTGTALHKKSFFSTSLSDD